VITNLPIKRVLSDSRVTNISKSFTHKMAVKTSWRRYGTKLRHCHAIYSRVAILSVEISRCQKRLRDVRVVEEHAEGCVGPASIEPLFVAANSCCPAVMVFSRSVHTFHEACNSGITWQTDRQTDRQTRAVKVPTAHYPLGRILYTAHLPKATKICREMQQRNSSPSDDSRLD